MVKILEREPCFEPWLNPAQFVIHNIFGKTKAEANPQVWKIKFRDFIDQELFTDVIYTDGSKKEKAAGYAGVYHDHTIFEKAVHPNTCILNIELLAILDAVNFTIENNLTRTVIATDSASALHSIANPRSTMNEIGIKIARKLNYNLNVMWIPGHLGFNGNELADKAANLIADENVAYNNELSINDCIRENITWLTTRNDERWRATNNKLLQYKSNTSYSEIGTTLNRYDRIKINRLRLGHSAYSHGFLISKEPPQTCSVCDTIISIQHLFQCPEFEFSRQRFNINRDGSDLKSESNLANIIDYMKDIDIYDQL